MKRAMIFLFGVAAIAAQSLPGNAAVRIISHRSLNFHATVSCAALCPYFALESVPQKAVGTCAHPFPPDSYSDVTVRVPTTANRLYFEARPMEDWDFFLCSGGRNVSGVMGAQGSTGAAEVFLIKVKPGATYVLRGYQFSDITDAPAVMYFFAQS